LEPLKSVETFHCRKKVAILGTVYGSLKIQKWFFYGTDVKSLTGFKE